MQLVGGELYSLEVLGQFRFVGNCPPTPPLSQYFALIENWEVSGNVDLGER